MIELVIDDGGREAAGYRGDTGDCVARAFAIATEQPYQEVYDLINELARRERPRGGRTRSSARLGVHKATNHKLADALGMVWTPTMQIGSGCTVHLTTDELPMGRIVVQLSRHVAAVIDRVLHDTYDSSRDGTRCVYGYWSFPSTTQEV